MDDTNLLTIGEAADRLRMIPSRVKRMAQRGAIPHVLLPDGEIRFDATDLGKWVQKHKKHVPGACRSPQNE